MPRAAENRLFTDLVIHCDGEEIHLHKIIVCTQSLVLRKACTGSYKVGIRPADMFPC